MKDRYYWTFLDIVKDTSEPPPAIIEDGILLDETLLLIIGPPKVGKTFLAFNLATALVSGRSFACFKIRSEHKVVILSAEGGYFPNRKRIRRITKGLTKEQLHNVSYCSNARAKLDDEEDYEKLLEELEWISPDVLMIDPLIRFHSVDENSSSSMAGVLGKIRELMYSVGMSVILIHHTGKQVSRGGRGSSIITGEYDSAIYMARRSNGMCELQFDTRHVEKRPNSTVRFNPDTYWFENAEQPKSAAVKYIEEYGPTPKKDVVRALVDNRICSQTHAYRLIQDALDREMLGVNGKELVITEE